MAAADRQQNPESRRHPVRVGMISLGCAKNLVDGEVMLGHLTGSGLQITPEATAADVVIVNTCGFINDAKRESIESILEVAEAKRRGEIRRLVVAGGETSGAVVSALGARRLAIGPEIDPGVPWTFSLDEPRLALALKSGNFGAPDFFTKAFEVLA